MKIFLNINDKTPNKNLIEEYLKKIQIPKIFEQDIKNILSNITKIRNENAHGQKNNEKEIYNKEFMNFLINFIFSLVCFMIDEYKE